MEHNGKQYRALEYKDWHTRETGDRVLVATKDGDNILVGTWTSDAGSGEYTLRLSDSETGGQRHVTLSLPGSWTVYVEDNGPAKPLVPTEEGLYTDRSGDLWAVGRDGVIHLVVITQWGTSQARQADWADIDKGAANYAPFTKATITKEDQ